jgi:nucleoside-diphosphate-sugar epimerase
MILFTGAGAFYEAYKKRADAEQPDGNSYRYLSLRHSDDAQFSAALKRANVVIHNAADIHGAGTAELIKSNFTPTARLVRLCLNIEPAPKLIYIGSMSYLHTDSEYMSEAKMAPYAYSKYLAEKHCLESALPNVCAVRFSTLFYQNASSDGLSKLIADAALHQSVSIYNGGIARRNFLPLDIAAAYVAKLAQTKEHDRMLNLAAANTTRFVDVVHLLKDKFPALRIEDHIANFPEVLADFSIRATRQLGVIDFSLETYINEYLSQLAHMK